MTGEIGGLFVILPFIVGLSISVFPRPYFYTPTHPMYLIASIAFLVLSGGFVVFGPSEYTFFAFVVYCLTVVSSSIHLGSHLVHRDVPYARRVFGSRFWEVRA